MQALSRYSSYQSRHARHAHRTSQASGCLRFPQHSFPSPISVQLRWTYSSDWRALHLLASTSPVLGLQASISIPINNKAVFSLTPLKINTLIEHPDLQQKIKWCTTILCLEIQKYTIHFNIILLAIQVFEGYSSNWLYSGHPNGGR